jgi:ribosome-binding protein aMBF1 (putative translation factor)
MSKARLAKEPPMTQKDLATKVNEKPSVINDYESGRAVPNQQVLAKLERALGVKLRGKGEELFLFASFWRVSFFRMLIICYYRHRLSAGTC